MLLLALPIPHLICSGNTWENVRSETLLLKMLRNCSIIYLRNSAFVLYRVEKRVSEGDSWILTLRLEGEEQRNYPKGKFRIWHTDGLRTLTFLRPHKHQLWMEPVKQMKCLDFKKSVWSTLAYFPLCTSARGLLWTRFPSTIGKNNGKGLSAAMSCGYGTARRHASRSFAPVQFVALTRKSKAFCLSKTSGRGIGKPDSYNTCCLVFPQAEYTWEVPL